MFDAVRINEVRTSRIGESTVQVPETKSTKIQFASHLQSDETIAIWCDQLSIPQETQTTTRKWFRTSSKTTTRESVPLVLMVTPRVIAAEDVVSNESN